jgi:anti-sigma28 factor (negative regulator of flagellin synthesis)
MNITNSTHIQSSQNIQGLHRASAGKGNLESVHQAASPRDTISFSEEALRLNDVTKTNTESTKIRFDLVNRIKSEIAAGTYDTPEKMDIALERMASRIYS